jgi:hypothetical protein
LIVCSFNNDILEEDDAAIDLSKDISIEYQGWYYDYMEDDKLISREPSISSEQPCYLEATPAFVQPLVPPLQIDQTTKERTKIKHYHIF